MLSEKVLQHDSSYRCECDDCGMCTAVWSQVRSSEHGQSHVSAAVMLCRSSALLALGLQDVSILR
jgi:hypothetical protein